MSAHFGRSWKGTRLEDDCPCEKAACGLVVKANEACDQHPVSRTKTMRQVHASQDCPALPRVLVAAIDHAAEEFFTALDNIAEKHGLTSAQWLPYLDGRGSDEAYEEWVAETWEPLP